MNDYWTMNDTTFVKLKSYCEDQFNQHEMWCRQSAYLELMYIHRLPIHFRFDPANVPFTSFSYVQLERYSQNPWFKEPKRVVTYVKYFIEKG